MTRTPWNSDFRPHCENGELARMLAKKLESRGLDFRLKTYADSMCDDKHVEKLVVVNPQAPERGEVHVGDDGGVTWKYFGTLDGAGTDRILDEITNALRATGLRLRRESA